MMKSYNQSLKENDIYEPYTIDYIEKIKESEMINPIRFKRLLATIDNLIKNGEKS